eukprot:8810384-Pyramimonas_sp.AAC.2
MPHLRFVSITLADPDSLQDLIRPSSTLANTTGSSLDPMSPPRRRRTVRLRGSRHGSAPPVSKIIAVPEV